MLKRDLEGLVRQGKAMQDRTVRVWQTTGLLRAQINEPAGINTRFFYDLPTYRGQAPDGADLLYYPSNVSITNAGDSDEWRDGFSYKIVYSSMPYPSVVQGSRAPAPVMNNGSGGDYPPAPARDSAGNVTNQAAIDAWWRSRPGGPPKPPPGATPVAAPPPGPGTYNGQGGYQPPPQTQPAAGDPFGGFGGLLGLFLLGQRGQRKKRKKKVVYVREPAPPAPLPPSPTYTGGDGYAPTPSAPPPRRG